MKEIFIQIRTPASSSLSLILNPNSALFLPLTSHLNPNSESEPQFNSSLSLRLCTFAFFALKSEKKLTAMDLLV